MKNGIKFLSVGHTLGEIIKKQEVFYMRAVVDKDTCISCGLCMSTEPSVFVMDDDGKAVSVADTTDDNRESVEACITGCPVNAIHQEG